MPAPAQRLLDWDNLELRLRYCYEGPVPFYGRGEVETPIQAAWLVVRGWGQYVEAGSRERVRATKGEWMLLRPGVRRQTFSADARLLSVGFYAQYPGGQQLFGKGRSVKVETRSVPELEKIARRLTKFHGAGQNPFSNVQPMDLMAYLEHDLLFKMWMREWCRVMTSLGLEPRSAHADDPRVNRAIRYLQAHLEETSLTAERVASAVGLSFSQLNRLFLRDTGMTLTEFHKRRRLEQASQLLQHSSLSIKEIASDLGFRHHSHFTAWYRRYWGETPTASRSAVGRSR